MKRSLKSSILKLKSSMQRLSYTAAGALAVVLAVPGITQAATLNTTIQGYRDIYLAGMPAGSTASADANGLNFDTAPGQSPVEVTGLTLNPGTTINFSASAGPGVCSQGALGVNHDPSLQCFGPNGNTNEVLEHLQKAENGISDIIAPAVSLIGVFLDNNQPNLTAAPALADFSSPASQTNSTINPLLKQVFLIGSGRSVVVPANATRLFLGIHDGYQNNNNTGSDQAFINVALAPGGAPVPEPSSGWSTLAFGVVGAGYMLKRQLTKQNSPR